MTAIEAALSKAPSVLAASVNEKNASYGRTRFHTSQLTIPVAERRKTTVNQPRTWKNRSRDPPFFQITRFFSMKPGSLTLLANASAAGVAPMAQSAFPRSEERRVGKECRCEGGT